MVKVTKVSSFQSPDVNYASGDFDDWLEYASKEFTRETADLTGEVGIVLDAERHNLLREALRHRLKVYHRDEGSQDSSMREGLVFEDFLGMYKIEVSGKKFYIEIDNEPIHVLTRTTGRSGFSCEAIYGGYWTGPFHDIALRNATAYIYDEDTEWIGRLNLRWTGDALAPEIGLDPNIYPMNQEYWSKRKTSLGTDRIVHLFLNYIFTRDVGLMWYDLLKTPYKYRGHSDTTSSGHVRLPHHGLLHESNKDILDNITQLLAMDSDIYTDTSMNMDNLN